MFEPLKDALMTGFGAALVGLEKLEAMVEDLESRGKISRAEADKIIEELRESGKAHYEVLKKRVQDAAKDAGVPLKPVDREEFEALHAKVEALEKRLDAMEIQAAADKETAEG